MSNETKAETIFMCEEDGERYTCMTGLVCEECIGECYFCTPVAEAREVFGLILVVIDAAEQVAEQRGVEFSPRGISALRERVEEYLAMLPEEEINE